MIEGVLALAGALAGAWLWWLRHRAKTKIEKADEEIEEKNDKRKRAIDGWVRGVDRNAFWIDRN